MMDKLKMSTPDLTDKNIEQIGALFPNVITETRDENGAVKKAVDFDLLKQMLSKNLVEDDNERYRLDWPGKKASLLKANTPITKTLRPCREESVNFDITENLYIEGDNFEVLKILQESYLGKIKMIYIDPPYNTGNDFIYKDDFAKSKDEYEEKLGTTDEEDGKLFRNTDSNGRYHSDWLSMMYERLIVARDLLKDNGVIFISIDDNEQENLKKICDELFGSENYRGTLIWQHSIQPKGYSGTFSVHHNFIYCYAKSESYILANFPRTEEHNKNYSNPDNDPNGAWRSGDVRNALYRPNLIYDITTLSGKVIKAPEKGWRWSKETIKQKMSTGEIIFSEDETRIIRKIYLNTLEGRTPETLLLAKEVGSTRDAANEIKTLFDGSQPFDTPKPTKLLGHLICLSGAVKNDFILDFFSGSATTAHAVMQLNAEDAGNRKFIMVQLPEPCNENSEAFKAGYKTIAEIGKERIRRAGKKIVDEFKVKNQQLKLGEEPVKASKLDFGFRVYKTDSTNMEDVFYHPSELKQDLLSGLESNIKEDRTAEDLLTQVILDLGLELTLPIETKQILGNTVFIVQTNALVACFDKNIDFKIVDTISDLKPLKVVFKDASFKDDKDRINVEERFKRLSPETKVTVL
jgi:adenine-specific DNA-methyltransferase